jgi:acylphosphatase
MSGPGKRAARLRISGQVQGVWFRAWAREQAQALGLDGWVRNRRDDTVEALIAGTPEAIDEMVRRCHAGPPAARVAAVEVTPAAPPAARGFRQMPTE